MITPALRLLWLLWRLLLLLRQLLRQLLLLLLLGGHRRVKPGASSRIHVLRR